MSRLDDIEKRLAALEQQGGGYDFTPRIAALEECLGISVTVTGDDLGECPRCRMAQSEASVRRCPQTKCPLK